eukprot:Tbor_TRINITY_DN2567_c0_g1::TRINITY_DN2567_c0_g1_i2::g.484::m.484/K00797/speE, SRM; spermidine synthase
MPMNEMQLSDGWFREESVMWPGQAMSLKVKEIKVQKKTQFQDLAVFENDGPWGTVLTLDGAIQVTDKDEFVYHEMMAHVPLTCHPNPKSVLIIGGGDGGVMREVLKHASVESCDLIDIDGDVIEQSKIHFPEIAASFSHPKANAMVGDGAAFIATRENQYDVIIVDSSDPEGPASALFGAEFYTNVKRALKAGGIVCSQGESLWIHKNIIMNMMKFLKDDIKFGNVKYGMIYIPTYPCGSIGCLISAKDDSIDVMSPSRPVEKEEFSKKLKYYTSRVHEAAFVLPRFGADLNE